MRRRNVKQQQSVKKAREGTVNPRPVPERPAAPARPAQAEIPPAPKPEPDFVLRMQQELEELQGRILRLEEFKDSEKFETLDVAEKELLQMQLGAMNQYRYLLSQRRNLNKLKEGGAIEHRTTTGR
ncbi:crAss001_48 related protein [Microbulbifer sp. EKSA008]|uniref:crAss001_48 related protein n=1 Tax=Microbulbifer sp. EKSA008 TaxID=3243367 RepID=UPI004042CFB7